MRTKTSHSCVTRLLTRFAAALLPALFVILAGLTLLGFQPATEGRAIEGTPYDIHTSFGKERIVYDEDRGIHLSLTTDSQAHSFAELPTWCEKGETGWLPLGSLTQIGVGWPCVIVRGEVRADKFVQCFSQSTGQTGMPATLVLPDSTTTLRGLWEIRDARSSNSTLIPWQPIWSRFISVVVITWVISFCLLSTPSLVTKYRANSRTRKGNCPKCDYRLNQLNRCPECGFTNTVREG